MPWPDFTELTFGYAFLREFEDRYVHEGGFPKAPDFISQGEEATKGYDVEIALSDATPVFLQLKRSYVLTTKNAKEVQDGSYTEPRVYRMNLHKNGAYRQHKALRRLEATGSRVFYVTSQIYTYREFASAFSNGEILSKASALFAPGEIDLPDDTDSHHVSFKPGDRFGYVYSGVGERFDRKLPSWENALQLIRGGRRDVQANRAALADAVGVIRASASLVDRLALLAPDGSASILESLADRSIEQQASILSYFVLDAHLTFVKMEA